MNTRPEDRETDAVVRGESEFYDTVGQQMMAQLAALRQDARQRRN